MTGERASIVSDRSRSVVKKRTGLLVAGVMLLCAVGTPMMADGQPGVPIDPNPFLALLPALRTAPRRVGCSSGRG